MKIFVPVLLSTWLLFAEGCKKCNFKAISGDYTMSGTSTRTYLISDSITGDTWFDTTTAYTGIITVSKVDNDNICLAPITSGNCGYEFIYQKKLSTAKKCTFTCVETGRRSDTIWFIESENRLIFHSHYGHGFGNTSVIAEGIK